MQRLLHDLRTASQPLTSTIAGLEIGGYSSRVRRFIILIAVLQLVAGDLVGLAHAGQWVADPSALQSECQNAPIDDGNQNSDFCDFCSHGLVNGVGLELDSKFPVFAPSNPVPAEQSAANSWLDYPAGEPPK